MGHENTVWKLFHGAELLGTITVTGTNFPWLNATFEPTDAFDPWRPLFDDELRLMDTIDDNIDEWEAAYNRISVALTLHKPTGQPVAEFLLHIDNHDAWWRWEDEPFEK